MPPAAVMLAAAMACIAGVLGGVEMGFFVLVGGLFGAGIDALLSR